MSARALASSLPDHLDKAATKDVLGAAFNDDTFFGLCNRLGIVTKDDLADLLLRDNGYQVYWDVISDSGWQALNDRAMATIECAFRNKRAPAQWTESGEESSYMCHVDWTSFSLVYEPSNRSERALQRRLVQWQYERAPGCWSRFDEEVSSRIENSFIERPQEQRLEVYGYERVVQWQDMTIKNNHLRFRSRPGYRIRRLEGGRGVDGGDYVQFQDVQWQVENTCYETNEKWWDLADNDLTRFLERKFSGARSECNYDQSPSRGGSDGGTRYAVDWDRLQLFRFDDGTTQRLRRIGGPYPQPQHQPRSYGGNGRHSHDDNDDNAGILHTCLLALENDIARISLSVGDACDAVASAQASSEFLVSSSDINDVAFYPPEDPYFFWGCTFGDVPSVSYADFVEMFECECINTKLPDMLRATLLAIVDGFPRNHSCSLVEFKRLCHMCAASNFSFQTYIQEVGLRCT